MSLNAEFQYDEITANLNYCGEQGPQGPQGPAGPTDLSNYNQNPIKLSSNWQWDEEEEDYVQSQICLRTNGEEDQEYQYADIRLEDTNIYLETNNEMWPAASGISLRPGSVSLASVDWPSYDASTVDLQNDSFDVRVFSYNDTIGDTHTHQYKFADGLLTERNNDQGNYNAVNLIVRAYVPDERVESWWPEANWPIGIQYLNTSTNKHYVLIGKETDPQNDQYTLLHWELIPQMVLLWENSDPSVAFDQVTVELNDSLASYRQICIESGLRYNGTNYMQSTATVGTDFDSNQGGLSTIVRGSSSMQFYTRDFSKVDDTHIQFQPCRLNKVTKSTGVWATEATNQLALIPFRIYGIK